MPSTYSEQLSRSALAAACLHGTISLSLLTMLASHVAGIQRSLVSVASTAEPSAVAATAGGFYSGLPQKPEQVYEQGFSSGPPGCVCGSWFDQSCTAYGQPTCSNGTGPRTMTRAARRKAKVSYPPFLSTVQTCVVAIYSAFHYCRIAVANKSREENEPISLGPPHHWPPPCSFQAGLMDLEARRQCILGPRLTHTPHASSPPPTGWLIRHGRIGT